MIQLVFAHNGYSFGSSDGMPWKHITEDFKKFKARTEGTTLVMGAKTFESLPGILKGRKHIVVSDPSRVNPLNKKGESAHQYITKDQFNDLLKDNQFNDKVFSVIGGKHLLETSLPYAGRVVKTSIRISHFDAKPTTQWLNARFLNQVECMNIESEDLVLVDPTTSITEVVYIK